MKRRTLANLAILITTAALRAAEPIIIADFESDTYGAWKVEGDAFGKGPAHGKLGGQQNVEGFLGKGLVNSFNGGDNGIGKLTSPSFKIERKFITFLTGGGGWANETCMNLLVDGKVVRTATGSNTQPGGSERLAPAAWDVIEFTGRSASIVIVDQGKGVWGHINVDHIVQADDRAATPLAVAPVVNAMVSYQAMINADAADAARYSEAWRPQYHFTPIKGWMNDPNGLCFFQGEYHLFYQHQFQGQPRSGANWGHAVSKDLVHWEHRLPAISPDEKGHIWSGSAVVDAKDTSGFFGGKPGLVCIYTYMNPEEGDRQSQAIAYSADGRTFTKYAKNPVLPQLRYQQGQPDEERFRDPKVFWHEPTQRWVMIVAGGTVRFYSSPNLRDWTFESINKDLATECPDLFELVVEGDTKETRWVLSGGGRWYLLGGFDGHKFTPEGKRRSFNQGFDFYASQVWNDVPDGRRLMTTWLFNSSMRKIWPTKPFNGGAMTLPYELKLRRTADGMRVFSTPAKELESLRGTPRNWTDKTITPGSNLLDGISGKSLEIEAEFDVSKAQGSFGFKVPKGGNDQTIIGYRVADAKMFATRSGQPTIKNFDRTDEAPLPAKDGRVKLRLFLDASSVEVFGNGGAEVITLNTLPDSKRDGVELFADGGDVKLISMKAWPLKSIWPGRSERTRSVKVTGDFLQLPLMKHEVHERLELEKLSIDADGKMLRYMNIKLPKSGEQPDFWYSADLREFKGREVTLRIRSDDEKALERLDFSDSEITDPQAYTGPNRPRFHLSPRLGWMNDINGSYYLDGLYHVFYQFNPATTGKGAGFDMHWGHSVSKDLVHWEEWPVAIFPDATGQCYSGTSVVVKQPIPGLIEKVPAPAMFFAATGPFSQHLATTPDGGRTWKRFAGNPVVPNIGSGDRDPKVIWHEASQHYVMVLYVGGKEDGYHFLRSKDLIKWEQTSVLPNWFECPEFIPMKSAITGEDLMMLYGCYRTPKDAPEQINIKSCYQLGRFDGKTFTPITKLRNAHLGPNFYAALIFQNEPKARPVMMGWAAGTKFPGEPFNQCASVPLLMQLKAINGEDTLCFEPAEEINALRGEPLMKLSNLSTAEANTKLQALGKNTALDVVVRFNSEKSVNVGIRNVTFDYDANAKTLKRNGQATVVHPSTSLDVRLLIDHGIIESFWNGGEAAYSVGSLHTDAGPAFAIEGDAMIEELTVYPMTNIWPCHQSDDVMIFEDGKEMPLSAGLEFHHGSWKFGDGAMIGEQVPTEKHLATIKGLVPFDHLKIEWKMKFVQPKQNFLFVTWPAESSAHAMDFTFNPDKGQFAIVRPKSKDKDSAVLAKGQLPKLDTEWHDIIAIHDGANFTVTIDGTTITAADESFARPMGPFYLNGGGFDGAQFLVKELKVTALKP